ncbi:MAG: hypothetical protein OYL97_11770 [Candidatus Poribacteria bacterium]|nr:hypothetical protein [Candidatus Poribacteria bacterium]
MMLKRSLAFSCVLLFLGFNAFCDVWYSEDFDNFKDGDIVGQDEWKTAMNQKTCQIGSEVKRGDTGKSILVTENTMVSRNFDGTHDGIQYVSLFTQREKGAGTMLFYIGGDAIKWGGAAVFNISPDGAINALDGNAGQKVTQGKLDEWHHFRIVLDFKKKTYDFFVDDEQVVDDFGFRGEGGKGGVNPSLSWIFFGWDHPTALTAYIDDIEMGDGEGETAGKPQAVSASDKLATTWGRIKRRL